MKQAMNTLMGQMTPGIRENQKSGFSPASPYPFPSGPFPSQVPSSTVRGASPPSSVIDATPTKVESKVATDVKIDSKKPEEPKRYGIFSLPRHKINYDLWN